MEQVVSESSQAASDGLRHEALSLMETHERGREVHDGIQHCQWQCGYCNVRFRRNRSDCQRSLSVSFASWEKSVEDQQQLLAG